MTNTTGAFGLNPQQIDGAIVAMIALASVSVALAAAGIIRWKRRIVPFIKQEIAFKNRMMQCGELGPLPSDSAQKWWMRIGRFFTYCFVGKLEIEGAENLDAVKGPHIFAFNHSSALDPAVAAVLLNRKARWPVDFRVTTAANGLPIYLVGKCGVISVDPENGRPAYKALVKVLSEGEDVAIFPEALIHPDGALFPFKTGTVRAAQEASANRGETVHIVPVYIRYGRYPGNWVNKYVIWAQGLLQFFFPLYRRGAKIAIGAPIDPTRLPAGSYEAVKSGTRCAASIRRCGSRTELPQLNKEYRRPKRRLPPAVVIARRSTIRVQAIWL